MKIIDNEQLEEFNQQLAQLAIETEQVIYERFTQELINKLHLHATLLEKRAQVLRKWLPNSQELRELTLKLVKQQTGNKQELTEWSYLSHLKKSAVDYLEFQDYCYEEADTHPYNSIVNGYFVSIVTETSLDPNHIDELLLYKELDGLIKEYLETTPTDIS